MIGKLLGIICKFIGGFVLVCLIATACLGKEPEQKQEDVAEVPQIAKDLAEEESKSNMSEESKEYTQEEPKQDIQEVTLDDLKNIVESIAEGSFGSNGVLYDIQVDEENNTICFIINLNYEDAKVAVGTSSWDELIASAKYMSKETMELFKTFGREDVNFNVMIGDVSADKFYLGFANGELIYNVEDELNINN